MSNRALKIQVYFIIPVLLVTAAAGISPFIEALTTSFFSDIYGNRTFTGLENFRYLRNDAGFGYSLNITTFWAVSATVLSLFAGFMLAAVLAKKRKASPLLFGALLIPWGIPVYIAVPLWRALIHGNGGISILTALFGIKANLLLSPAAGFISCLAVNTWMTVPLTAFVLHGALKKIPEASVEAAVLDGANSGIITAFIYLPQVKHTMVIMGLLNFIKAFKEFTLVFLMTAGGPPLLSGITERYVIGATTTLDTFLYEVFSNTDNYGITSAYSVIMAAIVILLMLIWFTARKQNLAAEQKHLRLAVITALLQPVFSWPYGLIFSILYLAGIKKRRLFTAAAAVHAAFILHSIMSAGFLRGFSPGIFPAVFTLLYLQHRFKRIARAENPRQKGYSFGLYNPRITNSAYRIFNCIFIAFMIVSSAAIIYLLLWMSFSGVSACYIDQLIPPHAGIESFRRIFSDEHIMIYFRNTILVAGITGILSPAVSFPAAIWLHNRGRGTTIAVLTFIQILGITGGMHSLIPLYASFERIGLINSYIPLIIISIYHAVPFSLFTITSWLENFPSSFRDIALIEGASAGEWLSKIIIPLSRPVLTTAVMAAVIGAWNSFMAPLLFLNNENLYTISIKLYSFVGSIASGEPKWNIFAAASVVNCLIITLVFSRFRKPAGETAISNFTE